ncbi:DUF3604 domain-containing protein [Congregibacter sp.]|uniref:DUF3604 domain-containing protein n=1 Tax=Congregibacter sp. TaxID=2744308 RepID=UPI003F6CD885
MRIPGAVPTAFVFSLPAALALALALSSISVRGDNPSDKNVLWGDTHLHSSYSFDAFLNDNLRADPATAYRFAMGQPVPHPYHQGRVQLKRPLDFLAVSDHAEYLGIMRHLYLEGPDREGMGFWDTLRAQIATSVIRHKVDQRRGKDLFAPALPASENPVAAARKLASTNGIPSSAVSNRVPSMDGVETSTWRSITETADAYNQPGIFTTLIAWEWSTIPGGANLHRVVISDSDAQSARAFEPFGMDDSPYPEDLWSFLDRVETETGVNFVAIPHNSNISKGVMFDEMTLRGEEMTEDYARRRLRWEPIAEITQIKGDSETHPLLSPDDEFADFETYPFYIQRDREEYRPLEGDYLRSALRRGLELEQSLGRNPYQLGFIGSTDAHTGLSSAAEDNFHGKMATDSIPENKIASFGSAGGVNGWSMSASGLAAVWATENTREAIIDAMRRREVYATSGPRISLRFYAGFGLSPEEDPSAAELNSVLAEAAPMGSILRGDGQAPPVFFVEALHDPLGAFLDRIQIVKGWLTAEGESREQVFDVALSRETRRQPDGTVTPVEDTVDRSTGKVDNRVGAARLSVFWSDPEFDPAQSAFYYARVLQIPTARHSFLDALALGMESAAGQPDTIQERAYSSPIWYRPDEKNATNTGDSQ